MYSFLDNLMDVAAAHEVTKSQMQSDRAHTGMHTHTHTHKHQESDYL